MIEAEAVLEELVGIDSVSSVTPEFDRPNRPIIERLADYFDGCGWKAEILDVEGSPGKANLIAGVGDGDGGLVLAGHSDTVPYDEGAWTADPFRLTRRDERLYGLGAADMKGFIAVCVALASRLEPARLRRPLHFVATADEESSMDGARALQGLGRPPARYCIIGEPTDLRPVRMHKGVMMEALVVEGGSGHSSDPESVPNALEGLARLIPALLAWREELKSTHRTLGFAVPHPTLNLGHAHGGDNPNRICGQAELHIDLRPVPGMDLEELRSELDRRMEGALRGSGCRYARRRLFDGISAFETPPDSRLVRVAEDVTGTRAESVSFGTEAGFFSAMGMETIVLGPGRIVQAHRPDEYIERASLARGGEVVERLVDLLVCG